LLSELEALIETTSALPNVLVVGTATTLVPDSQLDNTFGIKLVLPGTPRGEARARTCTPELRQVLAEVARMYHAEARDAGFRLEGMDEEYLLARVLDAANNPAEIEDILSMCRTLARYEHNRGAVRELLITPEVLETAIGRVIVSVTPGTAEAEGGGGDGG
jgi:hypothetical protein